MRRIDVKHMRSITAKIRRLLEHGRLLKLWRHSEEVADALGIPHGTFTNYLNDHVRDEAIIRDFSDKVHKHFDQKKPKKPLEEHALLTKLREAYLDGIERLAWRQPQRCGKRIRMSPKALAKYLKAHGVITLTPKRKKYVTKAIGRIHRIVGHVKVEPQGDEHVAAEVPAKKSGTDRADSNLLAALSAAFLPSSVPEVRTLLGLFQTVGNELTKRFKAMSDVPAKERVEYLKQLVETIDGVYEMIDRAHDITPSRAGAHRERQKDMSKFT